VPDIAFLFLNVVFDQFRQGLGARLVHGRRTIEDERYAIAARRRLLAVSRRTSTWFSDVSPGDLRLSLAAAGSVNVARGEAGIIGGQLDVNRCEFRRLPGSTQGSGTPEVFVFLLRRTAADLQRSPDGTRRHSVDTNAPRSELLGQGPGIARPGTRARWTDRLGMRS